MAERATYHRAIAAADVAPGDVASVEIAGVEMVVYRDGDDYYAAQRQCLHQRADLALGIVSGGFLICPLHGWRYHVATGRHELSPQTCLRTYDVRLADGYVEIDPTPRWRGIRPDEDEA